MTFENSAKNGASTEQIPATKFTKIEPLTSPFTPTESPKIGSVSDTASGGTPLDKDDKGKGILTAENYTQSLFGEKRPWGLDPFDRSYPTELDFGGGAFDKAFNTLPIGDTKTAKLAAKQKAAGGVETEPDGVGKKTEKTPTGTEFDEKFNTVPAKQIPTETITDPFDPKFNQVPEKTDGTKTDGTKVDAKTDEKPGDKKPGPEGQPPKATPGSNFFGKALTGLTDTLTGAVDEAAKLPEKAIKEGSDALASLGTALGFGADQEAARIVGNAEKGKKHADSQDEQYIKQLKGLTDNGKIAPPKEGEDPNKYTHTNADKSSYTVTNGKISDFQTAPTKDHTEGVKYSDIKYDAKGQIESYSNSHGQTHTRISAPDAHGFANWKSTDTTTGKPSNYGESSTWRGKPAVDTNGFHNLIGSGTFSGQMFSRQMDGSQVMTKPEFNSRGQRTGLETTTTLPDNTKVTQKGHFNGTTQKLEHSDTVKVKEGDGPKSSQVKFEGGSEKGALVEPPKAEKSAGGDSMMGMFKDILSPESLNKLKDVKELSIQRNGPHSFHVDGHMNNVFMEPPHVTVGGFGPLGRVSATPQGGFVNKFDMNMHIGQNRVDIDSVHGVHGTASLARQRRNGSVRGIGSTGTTTTGATWDMNSNTITARSAGGPPTALDARNFPRDSFTGNLLSKQSSEDAAKNLLQGLDKNLDGASLKQVKPGVFDASLELKQKQIPIDAKIPGVKANIYLDDKVNFTRSAEGVTFKPGEAQLGVQIGKGLEERKDIAKLSSVTNDKGEQSLKIEFHGKHEPMTIPIPKGDAAKPGDGKTPAAKPEVKPAVVKPEVKPEAAKPEVKPAVVKPEVKPAAVNPEVKPAVVKPDTVKAENLKPEAKTVKDIPDADLSRSYRDLKGKLYTPEGANDPNLKKQLEALENEKVSRLKSALGKGDDAFAKAIGDIDFNDRNSANLTANAFGDLCREKGFGGELKYFTEADGSTDVRLFMQKDNKIDQVRLKSSTPNAEESKELASAVRKSLQQRGIDIPTETDKPSANSDVTPPAVKVEPKVPQPTDKHPAAKTERDAVPPRAEAKPQPVQNHQNNCYEGAHRRPIFRFGRRR